MDFDLDGMVCEASPWARKHVSRRSPSDHPITPKLPLMPEKREAGKKILDTPQQGEKLKKRGKTGNGVKHSEAHNKKETDAKGVRKASNNLGNGKRKWQHSPGAKSPQSKRVRSDKYGDILLGTDFSGLETPSIAAERCGISTRLVFACEKEPALLKMIEDRYHPDVTYSDINPRSVNTVPKVDLYIAGASCQPWSTAGLGQGKKDKHGRGDHLDKAIKYVVTQLPKAALLENVAGLESSRHSKELQKILRQLGRAGYTTFHQTLSTHEHGIPQHRPRIYIVAIRGKPTHEFEFPAPLEHTLQWDKLLDECAPEVPRAMSKTAKRNVDWAKDYANKLGYNVKKDIIFVDIDASQAYRHLTRDLCPCLTKSRGRCGGYYLMHAQRRMSLDDIMRLQGFNPKDLAASSLQKTALGAALGNAMSVNILERLLPRVCYSAGLVASLNGKDKWTNPDYNPLGEIRKS